MNKNQVQKPSYYIEKVSLVTGEVLSDDFGPEELLVRDHRDFHIVETYARHLTSVFIEATGDEKRVKAAFKKARNLGKTTADMVAKVAGKEPEKVAQKLFGLKDREFFFRYKPRWSEDTDVGQVLKKLNDEAREALDRTRVNGQMQLRVLLTGGTGFVGKELMWQAATMPEIAEMVVLIRPKTIRDRKTKEVIKVLSPEERGQELLKQLWLDDPGIAHKFRFIAGDIEQPRLGVADEDFEELCVSLTNVIHCAASVAFDDPYQESFMANVVGSRNALAFSRTIQEHKQSKFVSHLSIETSYIHGRQTHQEAREDEIVFPRNFYNNYYELTKAMASLETEEAMIKDGLRVVQLCPAIVVGEGRTGNNRGDLKVVNAPVNAFGRAYQELKERRGKFMEWSKAKVLTQMANIFPGDPSAELNIIPVDWVAAGILRALSAPRAVGQRIHLATDSRIKAKEIQDILREELRVKIKLAEPTFHRNFQLPVLAGTLRKLKQPRVAHAITKLDDIFGGYSERNQPVHEVGNDVTILGMPEQRPNTKEVFRMVCRHNKYVQDFGKIRDLNVIKEGTVVRAVVPVDLRRRSGEELGNKFGLVFMNLPIGIADPREQLAAVKAFMNELKESPQAVMVLGLLSAVGTIPAELEKRVVGLFGASATAVLTNVPGPQEPLLLAGKEISSLMFWVPQSGGLGLGLSILSYNQQVRVGIATDAGLVDKPELLVQDVEAAFEELLRIECGELVTS